MADDAPADRPLRDEEIRRRIELLLEAVRDGRLHFAPHLAEGAARSLSSIRRDASGKVDLSTVDGRVRALSLTVAVMKDREDLKDAISLRDIQQKYFEYIDEIFGHLYREMLERGATPHRAAVAFSSDPKFVSITRKALPEMVEALREFWGHALEPGHLHVEDCLGGKAVFGGDLFPAHNRNIASECGLYTDTIIVPDPFVRTAPMFEQLPPEKSAYFAAKHALNVLQYKTLALAEVDPPILVVLPDRSALEEEEQRELFALAELDAVRYSSELFGQAFKSFQEARQFVEPLDTVEKAIERVVARDRVLFDLDWNVGPVEQLKRALEEESTDQMSPNHAGLLLVLSAYGRMAQATDLLLRSQRLRGTPLIQAETSWQYFQWKLQYEASRPGGESLTNLHMVRGLQSVSAREMEWLGGIPAEALIEIRKQGALPEIRRMLASGVEAIATAKPDAFHRTADQIVENIQTAFEEHKKNVASLTAKKWRFAGHDLGSWLVVGTLGIAAAATGSPIHGLLALAADQVLDAPKLRELPSRVSALREEARQIKRSPVGLLFAAHKKARFV